MTLFKLVKEHGFSEVFVLPNRPYSDWTLHRKDGAFHSNADFIRDDPTIAYPWANACLICVWAYRPYDDDSFVPAYYVESNRSYHAMKNLIRRLNEIGIRAERAETPYLADAVQMSALERLIREVLNGRTAFVPIWKTDRFRNGLCRNSILFPAVSVVKTFAPKIRRKGFPFLLWFARRWIRFGSFRVIMDLHWNCWGKIERNRCFVRQSSFARIRNESRRCRI